MDIFIITSYSDIITIKSRYSKEKKKTLCDMQGIFHIMTDIIESVGKKLHIAYFNLTRIKPWLFST